MKGDVGERRMGKGVYRWLRVGWGGGAGEKQERTLPGRSSSRNAQGYRVPCGQVMALGESPLPGG